MTSHTQHTRQRWNWQPILLLEASSPFPNSCLHVCSLHFSTASYSGWKCEEGGTVLPCNRARAAQGCSVGMSSGLQEIWTAVWLLTRRDTAGKICWLHIISSSLLECTEPHRSWGPFLVRWDYFLSWLCFIVNLTRTFLGHLNKMTSGHSNFNHSVKAKIITLDSVRNWERSKI